MQEGSSNTVKIYYPEFNLEELIERIKRGVEIILKSLPIETVILFGSYVEGKHTAASDVDLLIIYESPKRKNDYSVCWDAFKIPQLELFIYTKSEYEKLRKSGIAREVEKKGIIVWKAS
ncbi:MAG: nucleotidyltransferase domain-containing protein [Thermoproteota archaeon]